jgi:signal recognition particle receptor subunit beta
MVQFNFAEKTIKAKVVFYGPAKSGKTTNLEQIHRLTDPAGHNSLVSLNTAQDRTLFFDLLPISLGQVSGYEFKIQVYTVPGQVQYNATRRVCSRAPTPSCSSPTRENRWRRRTSPPSRT